MAASAALSAVPAAAQLPGAAVSPGLGAEFGLPGVPAPAGATPGVAAPGAGGGGRVFSQPDVRLRGFFDETLDALLPSRRADTAPAFDYFGAVTLRGLFTDNFRNTSDNRASEFVGTVRPTVGAIADTARLVGQVRYSPSYSFFVGDLNQPARLDHRFLGNMTATVVPGSVFVNARAFGALTPILPGQRLEGDETPLPRGEFTQTTTFSVSPYVVHRFGTLAGAIAGYTWTRTERSGSPVRLAPDGPTVFVPSVLTTHTGYAAVRTGEDFGRFAAELRGRGTVFEGGGPVTDGGHRALGLLETRYAFTRTFAGLAEGGYESLRFGGTRPLSIDEPVWGVGARLDLAPASFVIVRYRRRDGFDSPQIDSRIALGPRTVAFANYFERLGTGLLTTSDLLSTIEVDELGNAVDARTGSPTAAFGGSGLTGAAGGTSLTRIRRGGAGVTRLLNVGSVTFRYTYERLRPISNAPGVLGLERESHSVAAIWTRPLAERTDFVGIVQAGHFDVPNTGTSGQNYLGRALVRHLFAERLAGTLQYQLSYRHADTSRGGISLGSRDTVTNTIIATLTQAF